MDDLEARLALACAPRLAPAQLMALRTACGGDFTQLRRILGSVELAPETLAALRNDPDPRQRAGLDKLLDGGTRLLLLGDAGYPPQLAQIASPPPALWVAGDVAVLGTAQLAVVGSRNPTPLGRATARDFAGWFARAGLTVTSGFAVGIDAAAHEGALRAGGYTIAVLGTGLDRVYPADNSALGTRIRERGALVSEFPPGTPPLRANFPRRNRIISGLALGTLVVEAARYSGSLVTARCALEQGREVFAIPGSIHSPVSRGCHKLIREGARLVEEANDVLEELRIAPVATSVAASVTTSGAQPAPEAAGRGPLDKEYEMLLDALAQEPATIDTLGERTGLPVGAIASMLLIRELEGHVAPLQGGRYGRTSPGAAGP